MKLTTTMKSFIVLSALLAQTPALRADEDHEKNHPCKEIAKACEAAGFKKGDHKDKKGLWKDCVDPILEGTAVPGVTASPENIAACKQKKAEHKK